MAALQLVPALLLGGAAHADTLWWDDLDGGSFQDAGRWQDAQGDPAAAPPQTDDLAGFDLGDGAQSLTSPVTLGAEAQTRGLAVLGGSVELDLSGHDFVTTSTPAEGSLQIYPQAANRQPELTISNTAPEEARFRAPSGSVQLSGGGTLRVEGARTGLEALHVAAGVAGDSTTGAPSLLNVSGAELGAVSRIDVGASEDGELVLEQGARIRELPDASGRTGLGIYLGSAEDTRGTAVVRDAGTRVEATGVVVGGRGEGRLLLQDGAELVARDRIRVSGRAGLQDALADGDFSGTSLLEVGSGASLTTDLLEVGPTYQDDGSLDPGAGRFALRGGSADVGILESEVGRIDLEAGHLVVRRGLRVHDQGDFTLGARMDLEFTRASHRAEFGGDVVLADGSELHLNGGSLRAPTITLDGGTFVWNGGSLTLSDSGATAGQGPDALLPADLRIDASRPRLRLGGALTIDGDTSSDPGASGGAVTLAQGGSLDVSRIERVNGGTFTWTGGHLTYRGEPFRIESGGLVGSLLVLDESRSLRVTDATVIHGDAALVLDGGSLRTGSLVGEDFTWHAGTLDVQSLRVGQGADLLDTSLDIGADRTLRAGALRIEDGRVVRLTGGEAQVGSLDLGGASPGRFDFESGELTKFGDLRIGDGGVTGAQGAQHVVLASDDALWGAGATTVGEGARVDLQGGSLETATLALEEDAELRFGAGRLHVDDGFSVGQGGVTDLGGGASVRVGDGDELVAETGEILVADGAALQVEGGLVRASSLAQEGTGATHFSSGEVRVAGDLAIGGAGLRGAAGAGTVAVGSGDRLAAGTVRVEANAVLSVEGGAVTVGRLDAGDGAAHFRAGTVVSGADLAISADGLQGDAGSTTVQLSDGDRLHTGGALAIADDHGARIDGGELVAAGVQGPGDLELERGSLRLLGQDLYIGSGYDASVESDADADGLADGYRLARNTAAGDAHYYRIGTDAEIFVGRDHTTHVDASGLEIADGGTLSTWELDAPEHVTVREGGTLDVRHVVYTVDSLFEGTATAELVDVGAQLTLGSNAQLFSQQTRIAAGGAVRMQDGSELGGVATVQQGGELSGTGTILEDVQNDGVLAPGQSPGELRVKGDYAQGDAGSIVLEVGRDAQTDEIVHDALRVSGSVDLGGALEIVVDTESAGLDPLFDPASESGISFTAILGSMVEGSFASLVGTAVGDGLKWVVEYFHDRVDLALLPTSSPDVIDHRLRPVPEAGAGALVAAGLLALALRRRRAARRNDARSH